MKQKSFNSGGPLKIAATRGLQYGEILGESYYKIDKNGQVIESTPNTSEMLNEWFKYHEDQLRLDSNNHYFYLAAWNTGIYLEVFTTPDGVTTERLIYKPNAESGDEQKALEAYKNNVRLPLW